MRVLWIWVEWRIQPLLRPTIHLTQIDKLRAGRLLRRQDVVRHRLRPIVALLLPPPCRLVQGRQVRVQPRCVFVHVCPCLRAINRSTPRTRRPSLTSIHLLNPNQQTTRTQPRCRTRRGAASSGGRTWRTISPLKVRASRRRWLRGMMGAACARMSWVLITYNTNIHKTNNTNLPWGPRLPRLHPLGGGHGLQRRLHVGRGGAEAPEHARDPLLDARFGLFGACWGVYEICMGMGW